LLVTPSSVAVITAPLPPDPQVQRDQAGNTFRSTDPLFVQTGPVTDRLRVREIDDDEGGRLVRIVRRGTGSVVTWRRAQMVLLSAQGMDAAAIAKVAFTSEDRVRDVIRNFNADGFSSLYPKYKSGRPPKFSLPQRREIKKIAKSRPAEHDLPFSAWSLSKLADFLVAEGVVDDISHEGLRTLLREEGVSFQRLKTWKASRDPRYAEKKARVEHLYAIADGEVVPEAGEPEVTLCVDESGPLNLQPRPGRQWAAVSGKGKDPGREPRPRMRATYTRTEGVRHLFAAYELGEDKLFGHVKPRKTRGRFLEFCRYLRSLYPPQVRIAIVCDNFSPHLTTARDDRVGTWAAGNNVEIAYTPTNSSWLNRIEAKFTALRYFALDGTDHASHKEQASTIRRLLVKSRIQLSRIRRTSSSACPSGAVPAPPAARHRKPSNAAPSWRIASSSSVPRSVDGSSIQRP
jgi:transposase